MATFEFTSPEGKSYTVSGPDGATHEQAFAMLQTQIGNHEKIANQIANDPISQGAKNFTSGMSGMEKFNAGAGKAISDLGMGIKLRSGFASRQDVADSRALDAPLMKTGAGVAGNIGGNIAMMAPAALIPGASTIPGAAAMGGVIGALQPSVSIKEDLLNTGLGAAGGAAGQWVANKAASAVTNQETKNALVANQNSQKVTAAKDASAAGYVIPPEDLGGGTVTKLLSGVGGKIKTAQVASERNQSVTNNLARKALGISEDVPLNAETLSAVRSQAGQAYDAVKNSGTVAADSAFHTALDGIASKYTKAAQAFPGAVKSEIPDLVTALKSPSFDADGAVEMTKLLRTGADKAFIKGDKGEGKAFKEAADALEGMLERHLIAKGEPDALKAFQDARALIAKTYSVQKGLNNTTGDVAASALAKQAEKGKPLTDKLLTIAQAGQAFPKATQALKEAPKTISPLDVAFAASKAIGGHGLTALSLGARPAARSIMLSGPMQRNALASMGEAAPANSLLRILAQEPVSLPLGMGGGNSLAAYLSQK